MSYIVTTSDTWTTTELSVANFYLSNALRGCVGMSLEILYSIYEPPSTTSLYTPETQVKIRAK